MNLPPQALNRLNASKSTTVETAIEPLSFQPVNHALPRREVTNSPVEEYNHRNSPCLTKDCPEELLALLCQYQLKLKVGRDGLHLRNTSISKEPLKFWHENSIVCSTMQGEDLLFSINRIAPECIHAFSSTGRYIETIPLKGKAGWFGSAEEIAKHRRYISRVEKQLEAIHEPTSEAIGEKLAQDADALKRGGFAKAFSPPADSADSTTTDRATQKASDTSPANRLTGGDAHGGEIPPTRDTGAALAIGAERDFQRDLKHAEESTARLENTRTNTPVSLDELTDDEEEEEPIEISDSYKEFMP